MAKDRPHKVKLSRQDLIKSGWTKAGIEEYLKEPDAYEKKTKEPLYLRRRVERVERIYGVH